MDARWLRDGCAMAAQNFPNPRTHVRTHVRTQSAQKIAYRSSSHFAKFAMSHESESRFRVIRHVEYYNHFPETSDSSDSSDRFRVVRHPAFYEQFPASVETSPPSHPSHPSHPSYPSYPSYLPRHFHDELREVCERMGWECVICAEPMDAQRFHVTPCFHKDCLTCISHVLSTDARCPVCRSKINST